MKKPLFVLSLGLALATTGYAANRALIVGIGNYPSVRNRLPGIDLDVRHMQSVAQKLGFKSDEIHVLQDDRANYKAVVSEFENWLIKGVGPQDHVLFYFSGHGAQIPDQPPLDETDGKDEVLVLYDAQSIPAPKPTDPGMKNVLVDDDFEVLRKRIPAKDVLVILDSCFSGGGMKSLGDATDGLVPKRLPDPDNAADGSRGAGKSAASKGQQPAGILFISRKENGTENYRALLASREDETAQAGPNGSLLTTSLYEALTALSGDSSLSQLLPTIEKKTQKHQHPMLAGDHALLDKGLRINAPTPPRPASQTAPPAPAPRFDSVLYSRTLQFVQGAPRHIDVSANATELSIGQQLEIQFQAPADGYITIFYVTDDSETGTVLFPNRFHPNGQVREGEMLTIPALRADGQPGRELKLTASIHSGRPVQKNLVVAAFSGTPVEFQSSDPTKIFTPFQGTQTRDFEVAADNQAVPFAAGMALVTVRAK